MNLKNIHTSRLIVIPITLEIIKDLIKKSTVELEKLGIKTSKDWPTKDTMSILPIIARSLEKDKLPSGFETWMLVKKDNNEVIGDIGFHGKPDEKGEVEVGYGLIENQRGKGFGFEALNAIMNWVRLEKNVEIVTARCLISNKPSAVILQKVGFKEISIDSDLIYWNIKVK